MYQILLLINDENNINKKYKNLLKIFKNNDF